MTDDRDGNATRSSQTPASGGQILLVAGDLDGARLRGEQTSRVSWEVNSGQLAGKLSVGKWFLCQTGHVRWVGVFVLGVVQRFP